MFDLRLLLSPCTFNPHYGVHLTQSLLIENIESSRIRFGYSCLDHTKYSFDWNDIASWSVNVYFFILYAYYLNNENNKRARTCNRLSYLILAAQTKIYRTGIGLWSRSKRLFANLCNVRRAVHRLMCQIIQWIVYYWGRWTSPFGAFMHCILGNITDLPPGADSTENILL